MLFEGIFAARLVLLVERAYEWPVAVNNKLRHEVQKHRFCVFRVQLNHLTAGKE